MNARHPSSILPVFDNPSHEPDRRYARCDERTSTLVYRSQLIRAVFGESAARMFMRVMKVDAGVARRVLAAPLARLRR